MINIIIYLHTDHDPKELVKFLLSEKLISSASIDENKLTYELADDGFSGIVYNIITAQSKSLLFNNVVSTIESKMGCEIPICSTPIVGVNKSLDTAIRDHTKPI